MRVLVTGANGMLGKDVVSALAETGNEPIATSRAPSEYTVDVTNVASIQDAVSRFEPEVVIHCAAYTKVDQAETDADEAFRVNEQGAANVASVCAERGIPICAVSTDFVFDGAKSIPYRESDPVNPLGAYGASKLGGEHSVRTSGAKHWIVRTAWLYGVGGKCFPDTILKAIEADPKRTLRVVADQVGSPTYTADLAAALVEMVSGMTFGTYHLVNSGQATWHELACAALAEAGFDPGQVQPIATRDWPTPAARPAYSVLGTASWESQGKSPLRPWRTALASYVKARGSR